MIELHLADANHSLWRMKRQEIGQYFPDSLWTRAVTGTESGQVVESCGGIQAAIEPAMAVEALKAVAEADHV